MAVSIIVGDALSKLKTLPSESVHCCISSPPYYGLRDYGVAGQIGLEPTPEAYVGRMVEVFRDVRRVLRNDGTLFLNIGDSYCSGNSNRDGATAPNCKPKDLLGIPWMLAFALRADGWYLRQDIIWAKPNPMPESVTDRCTKAHEYIFMLTKAARYFYDAEAIKEPFATDPKENYPGRAAILGRGSQASSLAPIGSARRDKTGGYPPNGSGRNKRSVWTIATKPYKGAHFATFPPDLIEPCILAGTSERGVCPKCGAPWCRQTEITRRATRPNLSSKYGDLSEDLRAAGAGNIAFGLAQRVEATVKTIGWCQTCSCNAAAVPATVLDPFFGAGTTGVVAQQHGRDCIGIELNPEYAEMAERRIAGKRLKAAA